MNDLPPVPHFQLSKRFEMIERLVAGVAEMNRLARRRAKFALQ